MMVQNKTVLDTFPFPSSVGILGATGSVGTQAVEVVSSRSLPVDFLTAHRNIGLAEEQIRRLSPRIYVMTDAAAAADLRARVRDTATRVYDGEALDFVIGESAAPVVIHSILGEAGLSPLLSCIEAGKRIGLANKESLVIGGDLFMQRAKERGAKIIPVDSEHSAIFQCLEEGSADAVASIILTASGGPFYGFTKDRLRAVTKAETLAHPTWKMGEKITVDSATLMNKGFEVIEAVRLFGVTPEQIQVLVHRESIIHSAVEYIDSAVIAQMSVPDMRLCVQYALTYPYRAVGLTKRLSLSDVGTLTFAMPDMEAFPLLALAFRAIRAGGGVPAVLNAANEVAVGAFLKEQISFLEIFDVVEQTVDAMSSARDADTLERRIARDREARRYAQTLLSYEK